MVKMMVGADFKNPGVIPEEIPLGDGVGDMFRYLNVQRIVTLVDHSVSSEMKEKKKEAAVMDSAVGDRDVKTDNTATNRSNDELLNRDGAVRESSRRNGDIGVYGFTVRPLLTNFLGLLHGGALAMSIEQAARMHAYGQTHAQLDVNAMKSSHPLNQTTTHSRDQTVSNAPTPNTSTSSDARHQNATDCGSLIVEQSASQNMTSDIDCEEIIPTIVRMEIIYKASMNNQLEITCTDSTCTDTEHSSDHSSASSASRGKERGTSLRKITGEVFNARTKDPKSEGQPILGSSATYTCFWSNT